MTFAALVQEFLAFERRRAPEAWEVGGVPIWAYVRQRLFDELARERGFHAERQSPPTRRYVAKAIAQRAQIARIARRYDARRLCQAPVLLLSHPRHSALGAQHVSPYTHFLLRELPGESYWDLQFSDAGHHHVDDGLERVFYLDALYQSAFKGYALAHRWGKLRRSVRDGSREVAAALTHELGFAPKAGRLDQLCWNAARVHHGWGAACDWLLDRVQPRLLLNVVHYNWPALALTDRAHRRGLAVAELQHGTVSPEHIAYNTASGTRSSTTPDYFLSFGEFWSDMVAGLGLPAAHAPPIGFSWLENRISEVRRAPTKALLVLSQRSIGVELSRLAVEAAKLLVPHGWRVVYRLHPGEVGDYRERMPWLVTAPLEVSDTRADLYGQFGEAGAQLGVYSTALFEGVAFSLPTLVARLPGSDALASLVRFGGARFVDGPEQVVDALLGLPGSGIPQDLVQRVWQRRAAENFRLFVAAQLAGAGSGPGRGVA